MYHLSKDSKFFVALVSEAGTSDAVEECTPDNFHEKMSQHGGRRNIGDFKAAGLAWAAIEGYRSAEDEIAQEEYDRDQLYLESIN